MTLHLSIQRAPTLEEVQAIADLADSRGVDLAYSYKDSEMRLNGPMSGVYEVWCGMVCARLVLAPNASVCRGEV